MKGRSRYDAYERIVSDGFVILKGSVVSNVTTPSFTDVTSYKLCEKLTSEGIIEDRVFIKDTLFSSYSTAASVVAGRNYNGWI